MAKAKVVGGLDDALTKAGKNVMKAINGEVIQHSNEKIVSKMAYGALNNGFGAAEYIHRGMTGGGWDLAKTFKHQVGDNAGKLNYGKIAGSYLGASAAMRVVSGGGVTKDRNGNANLIGVPFV